MKSRNRHPRLRVVGKFLLLLALLISSFYARPVVNAGDTQRAEPVSSAAQNPSQAENYRRLAAAKRKAAENDPARRDCYLAWARYYDCLADKYQSGDNRDCGKEPPDC